MTYDEALKKAELFFDFKYNSQCYNYSKFIVEICTEPPLTIVGGQYIDAEGRAHGHYWLKDAAGNIYDPTERQFGCVGQGRWEE